MNMNATIEPRPLGELFSELATETATLVRQEVALAKVEMTQKARAAGRDAILVATGAGVAFVGALALAFAAIFLLALAMPLWAAALIVGLVVTGIGAGLLLYGVQALKRIDPAPRTTIQTFADNKQWLREQVSR